MKEVFYVWDYTSVDMQMFYYHQNELFIITAATAQQNRPRISSKYCWKDFFLTVKYF